MGEITQSFLIIAVALLVCLILGFIVLRELLLWYWKVNHVVDRLENIETYLHNISEKLGADKTEGPNETAIPTTGRSNEGADHNV